MQSGSFQRLYWCGITSTPIPITFGSPGASGIDQARQLNGTQGRANKDTIEKAVNTKGTKSL